MRRDCHILSTVSNMALKDYIPRILNNLKKSKSNKPSLFLGIDLTILMDMIIGSIIVEKIVTIRNQAAIILHTFMVYWGI